MGDRLLKSNKFRFIIFTQLNIMKIQFLFLLCIIPWCALNGTWYAMTSREWYQGITHSIAGVDADAGGITFYP
jgi:hypothetical protein